MAITWGNRVTSTTQDYHLAKVVDTTLRGNMFATKMLLKAKPWKGETLKKSVKVLNLTNGKSFQGLETFDTTATDTFRVMQFTPAEYGQPVTLPYDEITINQGSEQVIDLMEAKMQEAGIEMADAIGTMFYADGTGNGGKDFNGLGNLVDDGTNAATIGGLARATYTTLKSTLTASGGTLTLAKMATMYDNCVYGMEQPTEIITNKTVFSLYEQLLTPQEKIMKDVYNFNGERAKAGTGYTYDSLSYRGKPIMVDEKATSGVMFFINDKYLEFYAKQMYGTNPIKYKAEIEGTDYSDVKGYGFSWTGWKTFPNALGATGQIILFGQMICTNPNRMGKLTGITTV